MAHPRCVERRQFDDRGSRSPSQPALADCIHRRFFLGAIAVVLTAGGTWGAWLLWRIAFAHDFTGISILDVNAHGQAQIFGWVGLFIMGFACAVFPRWWHTDLAAPRLGAVVFVLMLGGIAVRTAGMVMHGTTHVALPVAMVGGAMQIAAITLFVAQVLTTFARGDARVEPYTALILASLVWFIIMSLMSLWHTATTMSAVTRDQLLWYVATYQAPLRDIQVHGLALFMLLGISMRMLPAMLRVPALSQRRGWAGFGLLSSAVVVEVILFIVYRWSGNHFLAAMLLVPWLMLAIGCATIIWPWALWRPAPARHGWAKFVRAAFAWLMLSWLMLLLLPVDQFIAHVPFSHAYYGAVRHAITVGFISEMMMGLAIGIAPMLHGADERRLGALSGPFVLINTGCFLRVSLQTLTDFWPGAYHAIGISGVLEVVALLWWGSSLIRIMYGRQRHAIAGDRQFNRPAAANSAAPLPFPLPA